MFTPEQRSRISNSRFTYFEAFKLLHKICKEGNIPRRLRGLAHIQFTGTTPYIKPRYNVLGSSIRHWGGDFVIYVNVKWLLDNCTKKELAQLTRLRMTV